jgi:hypothetical protein
MAQGNHSGRIAALAFRLFCAAAVIGVSVLGHAAFASSEAGAEEKPAKIPGLADQNSLEHFTLQPFNVPVIRNGRVERIVMLNLTLETKGDVNKSKVMAERYRLHDAFLRDIYGFISYRRPDGQTIDPQMVKTRLLLISDRILGRDVVENVLVQSIFDRAIP